MVIIWGWTDPEYLARRRRLLGPEADITHPEFGRTNRREETFGLVYSITTEPVDDRDNPLYTPITQVREYIFDIDNNLVDTDGYQIY